MPLSQSVLYGSAVYHLSLWGRAPSNLAIRLGETWPGDAARGHALLSGSFDFAGEAARAAAPPWTAAHRVEWLAAMHGYSWLADIAAIGGEMPWQKAREWTADWLARCDAWEETAWRADVVGDRLVAWIEHFDALVMRAGDDGFRQRLLASFARQSRHLARVATHAAPGMPRLAALRGLVAAAAALADERRLRNALIKLGRECEAQLLPDGCHVERSPAAQVRALRYLIDARAALRALQFEVPPALQQAIDRAAPILRFFRHGDGRLALFNGSNEDEVEHLDLVLARTEAKGRPPMSAPHGGFQRLQAARTLVITDAGAPPAPGLDGDAHAGTLSLEMSHGRERLIVNCGAYHGPSPEWRKVARATAAHSTLVVADTNSSEILSDGRLGRRPTHVTCERAEEGGSQWISTSHDGYQPNFGVIHLRQLFLSSDGDDLRGEDRVSGRAGQSFVVRFHLHPQVQASLTQDGTTALLRLPSGVGWRLRAQGAVMSLAESIYLGGGERRKSQQIMLDGHIATAGTTVKWALRREPKKAVEGDAEAPG